MKIKLNVAVDNYGDKDDEIEVPTFIGEAWVGNGTASAPNEANAEVEAEADADAPAEPVDEPAKKKGTAKKATETVETATAVADDTETR